FQIKKLLKTMDQLAQRIPHGLQEWLINRFKMASKKENNLPINKRLKEENRSLYLKHVKPLGVTSKYCGSISPRDRIEIKEGESLEDAVLRIEKSIDGHFRRSKELYQVLLDYDLSDFSVFDEFFESNGMIVNIK
ncbi:MAG: hypothetical protein Q8Q35_02080, partial [Nanoarchaeota archaeon]|nr:hypothetical protein [Nanoarchaeota archaeon]